MHIRADGRVGSFMLIHPSIPIAQPKPSSCLALHIQNTISRYIQHIFITKDRPSLPPKVALFTHIPLATLG